MACSVYRILGYLVLLQKKIRPSTVLFQKKNSDTSTYGCTAVTVVGPCTEHITSSLLFCFRKSSGTYECTAVNGVSRPAKAEIQVRVKCKFLTVYDARLLYKLYFE